MAFGFAAALYQKVSGPGKALMIGVAYALGIIIASVASFAFINPAVALAGQTWEWGTYVLGPVLGAVIGMNLYSLLFAPASSVSAPFTVKIGRPTAIKSVFGRRSSTTTVKTKTVAVPPTKKPVKAAGKTVKKTTKTTKKK